MQLSDRIWSPRAAQRIESIAEGTSVECGVRAQLILDVLGES
jgi:hypothetical protein